MIYDRSIHNKIVVMLDSHKHSGTVDELNHSTTANWYSGHDNGRTMSVLKLVLCALLKVPKKPHPHSYQFVKMMKTSTIRDAEIGSMLYEQPQFRCTHNRLLVNVFC